MGMIVSWRDVYVIDDDDDLHLPDGCKVIDLDFVKKLGPAGDEYEVVARCTGERSRKIV